MIAMLDGKQRIVVAVRGGGASEYLAFALPE